VDPTAPPEAPAQPGGPARTNRPFWVIAALLTLAAGAVIIAAVLTRPDPPSGRAVNNLEVALAAARIVREESGTWADATAEELRVVELTLDFVPPGSASTGPTVVSVSSDEESWRAVARADNGACRAIEVDDEDVFRYSVGQTPACAAGSVAPRFVAIP